MCRIKHVPYTLQYSVVPICPILYTLAGKRKDVEVRAFFILRLLYDALLLPDIYSLNYPTT